MKIFISLTLLFSATAFACFHFPPDYKIVEGTKHAFLFHDGKKAHLIVNTDLTTAQESLPERLAWVLPFPSLPSSYKEEDAEIFRELGNLLYPMPKGEGSIRGGKGIPSNASPDTIRVHKTEYAGNYVIHPIEILSTHDGGKALNDWLSAKGFNSMPADKQAPYLKKGEVFLAVEMNLKGKTQADLKPLHITYAAENLEFPLRFTHDTRTFDIDLFVYTPWNIHTPHRKVPTYVPEGYLTEVASAVYKPESWGKEQYPLLRKLLGKEVGYLYRFDGRGLNGPGKKLADLKRDPFFVPQ